ncbi:uncharacterized protein ASPGLDRAFT_311611 [Aspergillus glaucus CBS 516.65]|uniref:Uncharacterized protein n=1 Tax=Aspergillus glaucus CBS 516.65 TaxID=1160497 RepID=A0A1L9VK25_ASPGL|nr:hypothetical protein ASPGLDRAFT_311611 [Aspergillus glaucus CBS 516.65]OJJ84263.1 hypothetical protein ASPGLDRAFT_311611 [Aspergillus glaucus CBS 516.65]
METHALLLGLAVSFLYKYCTHAPILGPIRGYIIIVMKTVVIIIKSLPHRTILGALHWRSQESQYPGFIGQSSNNMILEDSIRESKRVPYIRISVDLDDHPFPR